MKKLIAIAVVFVLAVGAAFAADVSVDVIGKVTPLQGDSQDGTDVNAYGMFGRIRIGAEGQNDDGNFGGWLRFEPGNDWGDGGTTFGKDVGASGFVWWKPHDILKVQIGSNPDGHWGMDGVTRWAFYQVGGDTDVVHEFWNFGAAFTAGFGDPGLFLTLTPIEPLEINLAFPITKGWGGVAKEVYKKFYGQVSYNIGGIGKAGVTYQGDLNELTYDPASGADSSPSKLYGYFGLTAVENLGIDLGVGYTLPVKETVVVGSSRVDVTDTAPVAVGLGVNFSAGQLGIKARVQGEFGGKVTVGAATIKKETVFTADLLPSFAVSDTVSALLSASVRMISPDVGESKVGWHIEPYVSVKANAWAPNFYAGIKFHNYNEDDNVILDYVKWAVPIGIWFSF